MKVRKAVIPVAGFGTRFLPATKATPKEMFPLVDKPLAQYVVEEAAASGIEEIIFVTGQAKRAIEDHFDRNIELEYMLRSKEKSKQLKQVQEISELVQFAYVRQMEMKGLGHAILQAKNLIGNEPFAVILPDNVFNGAKHGAGPAIGDVIAAYDKTQSPIVGSKKVPWEKVHLYGIAEGEETEPGLLKMTRTVEKPSREEAKSQWASVGRYVLFPEIFEILAGLPEGKGGEIQLNDAIDQMAGMRDVYAAEIVGDYHDAGDKMGYLKAVVEFALQRDDLGSEFREYLETLLSARNPHPRA